MSIYFQANHVATAINIESYMSCHLV